MTDGVSETSPQCCPGCWTGQGLLGEVKQAARSPVGEALVLSEEADVFQQVTCGKQNNRSSCWAQTGCFWKGHRTEEKATWT